MDVFYIRLQYKIVELSHPFKTQIIFENAAKSSININEMNKNHSIANKETKTLQDDISISNGIQNKKIFSLSSISIYHEPKKL